MLDYGPVSYDPHRYNPPEPKPEPLTAPPVPLNGHPPIHTIAGPARQQTPPQNPVDGAVNAIRKKLDDSGWFNDITHGELRDINKELAKLTPAQRQEAISKLSDDDLRKWGGESNSGAIFGMGGLDDGEKRALFNSLAEGLDGKQLARIANAFTSDGDARMLGDAIAEKGSDQAKIEFVSEMAGKVNDNKHAALMTIKAIASLRGASVDKAISQLTNSQLMAIISAGKQKVDHTYIAPGGADRAQTIRISTYDVAPLTAFIDAVATGLNNEGKARVFEFGATELKTIANEGGMFQPVQIKDGAEEKLTDSLSRLLTSDTNGVMRELETQFNVGRGITAYTEQMIRFERTDAMKVIINQLKYGNDLTGDGAQRFKTKEGPGGDELRNAQVLGYYMGSVYAATTIMNLDVDRQIGLGKALFAGGLSGGKDLVANLMVAAPAAKAAVGVAAGTIGATGVIALDEWARQIKSGNRDFRDAMSELAFPVDPATRKKVEYQPSETAYWGAVTTVTVNNP